MPIARPAIFLLALLSSACAARAADLLVLRANAQVLRDRTVVAMNFDGVKLDDGKVLGWDEIETGRLQGDRQELFDKYLQNVGVHLFRIRHRLGVGDYRSLSESAEAIAKYYQDRDSETAYLVMQALMWGRLAQGQREAAVAPYWRCFEFLRTRQTEAVNLPGERRLRYDAATGMCEELPPVWFDPQAAKAALPDVAAAVGKMKPPRPEATRVYYATLALAAGEHQTAERALVGMNQENIRLAELRAIIAAQQEVARGEAGESVDRLAAAVDKLQPANRPLALYWLGMAQIQGASASEKQQGVLRLLHLPAVHGKENPELAAAGLYHSIQTLKSLDDLRGSIALRSELLSKYGQTYYAARVQQ